MNKYSFLMKKKPIRMQISVFIGIFLAFFYVNFGLTSCQKKEKVTLTTFVELPSLISKELTGVSFFDEKNGFIVGGNTWSRGEIFATTDGGDTWKLDTVVTQKLLDIQFDPIGEAYAVGVSETFMRRPLDTKWIKAREDYKFARSCSFLSENQGLIVSGDGFLNGLIQRTGPIWIDSRDTFLQEISAVQWVDSSVAIAAGYGLILRSTDSGFTWERLGLEGDFFVDLYFPTTKTGYVVGEFGTILKTDDAGKNWKRIQAGGRAWNDSPKFKAIHFVSENLGFIVGDKGLLWRTDDGGDNWQIIENAPSDLDFADICLKNNTGWAVSTDGRVFRFGF